MAETLIQIGVIGCADIARKVSRAISLAPNATVCAVASRSADKASTFAAANGLPLTAKVYGSYEALLEDPEVDAVYMPLPTSLHLRWAVLAAQKKKHLLLEKPVALDVGQFDHIVEACESNGVQFMDNTMWVHNPRTSTMAQFFNDPHRFGHLKSVRTCFTFAADANYLKNDIRVKPDLDALGSLGDQGWYCIRAILLAANYELPKTVIASREPVLNKDGVILDCGASLYWEDGKVTTFHCSFLANLTMDITAIGTKGTLHVHDFIIPYQEKEASFYVGTETRFNDLVTGWDLQPSKHTVKTDLPQEALLIQEFARLVGEIKFKNSKPEKKWPIISRKTQLIVDAVKASIQRGFEPVHIQE
ncbi:Oxidoreductase, N-terminal [Sesbania bispinosa]|nr:Oxidoreductase, N-terminal [Sesbania bispinosa]